MGSILILPKDGESVLLQLGINFNQRVIRINYEDNSVIITIDGIDYTLEAGMTVCVSCPIHKEEWRCDISEDVTVGTLKKHANDIIRAIYMMDFIDTRSMYDVFNSSVKTKTFADFMEDDKSDIKSKMEEITNTLTKQFSKLKSLIK